MPEGRLLARAGLDTEDGHRSGRYVARAQVCALLEDVARLTGEPAIGIELGQAADPRRLGAAVVLFNIALVALFAALVPPSGDSGDAPVQEAAEEN